MSTPGAVTAAVEAAKSSPIVKAADAIGRALVPEFNVYAADCCGRFCESGAATLGQAKAMAAEVSARYPKAFVDVERPSNIDLGCYSGLTREERDFLDAPLEERHAGGCRCEDCADDRAYACGYGMEGK